MADTLEQVTIRKVAWRLLPFLFLMFIWCLIDRVNLAFASLTMNADLGFTSTMYSVGASIFFLGAIALSKYPAICCWNVTARASGCRAS
jgi:MFS transporter, ACS family, tartrate transporter